MLSWAEEIAESLGRFKDEKDLRAAFEAGNIVGPEREYCKYNYSWAGARSAYLYARLLSLYREMDGPIGDLQRHGTLKILRSDELERCRLLLDDCVSSYGQRAASVRLALAFLALGTGEFAAENLLLSPEARET